MEKKQFKLMVEPQLADRLTRLGAKLGYSSGNEFAVDALDIYAEALAKLMAELREDQRAKVKRQTDQLLREAQDSRRK